MSAARVATEIWVSAWLWRLSAEAIPAYVAARGDPTAGAVLVKIATLDGRAQLLQRRTGPEGAAWVEAAEGPEAEIDAAAARWRARDPDLWIVEVESREGRALLEGTGPD